MNLRTSTHECMYIQYVHMYTHSPTHVLSLSPNHQHKHTHAIYTNPHTHASTQALTHARTERDIHTCVHRAYTHTVHTYTHMYMYKSMSIQLYLWPMQIVCSCAHTCTMLLVIRRGYHNHKCGMFENSKSNLFSPSGRFRTAEEWMCGSYRSANVETTQVLTWNPQKCSDRWGPSQMVGSDHDRISPRECRYSASETWSTIHTT
jgi:hypothetical protein